MPFVRALDAAEWFVVVRNANTDLHSRIWCVCELMCHLALGKDKLGHVSVTGPDTFSHLHAKCEHAVASHADDKNRIREKISEIHGAFAVIDEQIQQFRNFPSVHTPQVAMETGPAGNTWRCWSCIRFLPCSPHKI